MKIKAVAILLIILFSLIPVFILFRYLQKIIRPRESMHRLFLGFLAIFALIFVYTFILVLLIKMVFPGA